MTSIISFVKQLLKPKKHTTKIVQQPTDCAIPENAIITRENHSLSKTNISINALKVLNRLNKSGYGAYLVGGSVRDLLLHHTPKDFDIATEARPNQVKSLFKNSRLIGRRFRLAHILFNREIIEVATFRAGGNDESSMEHKKSDEGMIIRDNVYGDIHQDIWRRDFTINALYYNIADFSIIDFCGGFQDLKDKTLRLIGDPRTRYQEDPVRMLRAIRFCAKLNFTMAVETAEPITEMAPLIKQVSNSRLFDEVVKLYHCGNGSSAHQLLCDFGLFSQLFPLPAQTYFDTPMAQNLLKHTLESTDSRIKQQKHITPAFLYTAILWPSLIKHVDTLQETESLHPLVALEKAMGSVLAQQCQQTSVPKRLTQVIREIWVLQYRLPKRYGNRPLKIISHPRFRAAYDFLLIRALAGDEKITLADWWTHFVEAGQEQREEMLAELKKTMPARRPRRKKPKND